MAPAMFKNAGSLRNLLLLVVPFSFALLFYSDLLLPTRTSATDADDVGRPGNEEASRPSLPSFLHASSPHSLHSLFSNVVPWRFDAARDADNFGLSDDQCSSAFPKLYTEIDHMFSLFTRPGQGVTKAQIDGQPTNNNRVKAMIYEGNLIILTDDGLRNIHRQRAHSTFSAIHRALVAIPPAARAALPNCEFVLVSDDKSSPGEVAWTYSKKANDTAFDAAWLIPDYGFFSWPEIGIAYSQARRDIQTVESAYNHSWSEKIPKIVWRGAPNMNPKRGRFLDATREKTWADAQTILWKEGQKNRLAIQDYCRYMFVTYIEGSSWSGGGKYIRQCDSVLITHKNEWLEMYSSALEATGPHQNFVQVADDWSNLEATITDLLAHPKKSQRIIENASNTLRNRYLTPAAEACYWRRLIRAYGAVSYEPELYKDRAKTVWRGQPWESVVYNMKLRYD